MNNLEANISPNEFSCLACKYTFTAMTGVDTDRRPHTGDTSMCVNCGALATFDVSDEGVISLKEMSGEDVDILLKGYPDIYDMMGDRRKLLQVALLRDAGMI